MYEGVSGVAVTFDDSESIIDIVIERTEKYYAKTSKLPTTAYVPEKTTDEEVFAIKDLGNIENVVRQYKFNMVLVGNPPTTIEERRERLDDNEEQKTW